MLPRPLNASETTRPGTSCSFSGHCPPLCLLVTSGRVAGQSPLCVSGLAIGKVHADAKLGPLLGQPLLLLVHLLVTTEATSQLARLLQVSLSVKHYQGGAQFLYL